MIGSECLLKRDFFNAIGRERSCFKTKMIGSDCLLKRDFFNAIGRGPANQDGGKFLACLYIR